MLEINKEIDQWTKNIKNNSDYNNFSEIQPEFLKKMENGFYQKLYMKAHRYAFVAAIERNNILLFSKVPSSKKEVRKNYLYPLNEEDLDNKNYWSISKVVNFSVFM